MPRVSLNALWKIPRGVWWIGFANLFLNISTTIVFTYLSVYAINELEADPVWVGVMDGILQAISFITRIGSGVMSDWLGKRRLLVGIGYGVIALSRPFMALGGTWGVFVFGHILDRIGNGIQAAPREALIGDISPPGLRGESYGLRQTLAIVGSVAGPLLAIPYMALTNDDYASLFWVSSIPALLGALMIFLFVRDPKYKHIEEAKKNPKAGFEWHHLWHLSRTFWILIGVSGIFTLARFGETFMILRGNNMGMNPALMMTVMNFFTAIASMVFGYMYDKMDRRMTLMLSISTFFLSDLCFVMGDSLWMGLIGVALWGVQIGATNSVFMAMVADTSKVLHRGTAFGVYNVLNGLLHVMAGGWAGYLMKIGYPLGMFYVAAAITLVTMVSIYALPKKIGD